MKFYSWKDIERFCRMYQDRWIADFDFIEVYPSEILVYKKTGSQRSTNQGFRDLFGDNFDEHNECIKLDIGNVTLPIYEQESQDVYTNKATLPLFRDVLYHHTSYPQQNLPALPYPLIAFHSYKGGVGRTLSLLAFAKAWSSAFAETRNARLLIVDADIEAPGMTWLQDKPLEDTLSYLDLLSLIQDNTSIKTIVDLACSKLKTSTISIETPTRTVEHIFIPTYRYEEQLLDLYATPESIVNRKDKEYILATVLSRICERLDLSATLVDLRAGISEFSSTLLLDPRVKKYLITSTSTQSIRGTQILLKYLMKGLLIQEDTPLPEVFVNMIPDTLPGSERTDMVNSLFQCYDQSQEADESNGLTDNVVTELPFASELIHLTSIRQILENLNGRGMYLKLEKLVEQNYSEETHAEGHTVSEYARKEIIAKIHRLANDQLTAESNSKFQVLMTEPLKYLGRKYSDSIPTTVIMGAKGAGKTFLYRKMAELLDWNSFCASLKVSAPSEQNGFFLPVIATRNSGEIVKTLGACITHLNKAVLGVEVDTSVYLDNQHRLELQISQETDWMQFWQELFASSINPEFKDFESANKMLETQGRKVVFLVDGLEDILKHVSTNEQESKAVQVLCQDIVTQLIARYHNLGIIIFLRRDMAHSSITVNFSQFEQTYKQAQLKWSSDEALRLALWLVNQADKTFYRGSAEIDSASQDVIEKNLVRLWGSKLGKQSSNEAYSSRWVLAALSDFNGQLQARDIIRFLMFATGPGERRAPYNDRILMPTEIRAAVTSCSIAKMEEVKQEYAVLQPILDKLENLSPEEKILPLDPSHAQLTSDEEKSMILEGYLKRDGDKYYLPEIIRHALGFKYGKGARPKVLSLTLMR